MKKRTHFYLIIITVFLGLSSCMDKTNKKDFMNGNWPGCVIGIYPEKGNATLATGALYEIDDFEALIQHEIGSVVWFPTWDDEFPIDACQKLADRGIIRTSHGNFFGHLSIQIIRDKRGQMVTPVLMMCLMARMMST